MGFVEWVASKIEYGRNGMKMQIRRVFWMQKYQQHGWMEQRPNGKRQQDYSREKNCKPTHRLTPGGVLAIPFGAREQTEINMPMGE